MTNSTEYFAGLFDGEGTVGIYSVGSPDQDYWAARLAIGGTYRPMIEAAWRHFAVGNLHTQKRQAKRYTPKGWFNNELCKQGWIWQVNRRSEVVYVLKQLLPFLLEKREQAEIVIRWYTGELVSKEAAELCRRAKNFEFPSSIGEPAPHSTGSACEHNPAAKLTWEKAETIRQAAKNGESQAHIVKRLGLSKTIVNRIILGKTYVRKPRIIYEAV